MEQDLSAPAESFGIILINQINTILVILARPIVQRQLLTIAIIVVVAWLLPRAVQGWLNKQVWPKVSGKARSRLLYWSDNLFPLYAPLTGLIITNIAIWWFARQDIPNGMLVNSQLFFWLWLGYRGILLILTLRVGNRIKPYEKRLLTPIFVLLILWLISRSFVGLIQLGNLPVFPFFGASITLGKVASALIILYLFFVAGWALERVSTRTLPERLDIELGTVQSIATLMRYAVTGLGILAALAILGLNVTSLAIVAGGLSVGIGIGLQDIVANFVSGLTLLFEQSLRPGDVIEVNGQVSEVERVSLRSTTLNTLDNIKVIVPNGIFTTSPVTTFTKTDRLIRLLLPVGVSYKSNPTAVRDIVEAAVSKHGLVLTNPAPALLFRGFGDSSLNFELAVWINQPERQARVKSDLYYMLFAALAEHKIEIPFPQRDLNLGRGWEQLGSKFRAEQAEE